MRLSRSKLVAELTSTIRGIRKKFRSESWKHREIKRAMGNALDWPELKVL